MADYIVEVSGLGLFRDNCLRKIYDGQRRLSSLKTTALYKKIEKKKLYIKKNN